MENMKFYIKYLDYQPVGLRTHILNTNTFVWLQTLFTVGDLVAAVKQALPSKLGAIPVDELTIHYVVDGPAIAGDVLLTSIQEPVGSYNQPLVIKSSSRMAGQTQDTVMNIEGPNPEAVYKNLHQLISLDENKTVFSTQDSMENIALDQGILNLDIQGIDGVPNFLYSEKIYSDEKEIGIEMPVDRLCKIKGRSIAMIGVSGCGKTRTCYDLCRRSWGLYFDCSIDSDFTAMTEKLAPAKKTDKNQAVFEYQSKRLIQCLISARIFVLKTLRETNPDLKPFTWLCIQTSIQTGVLFCRVFDHLSKLPWSAFGKVYQELKSWFLKDGRVIFDESQHMLNLLKSGYRSTKSHQQSTTAGQFDFPRSLFSFLTRTIIQDDFKNIWCGTQMRICIMDLTYSAAGLKPDNMLIFTDFNYLKSSDIFKLLSMWLKVDVSKNIDLQKVSQSLQGRPRLLTSFLHKLVDSTDIDGCYRGYIKEMTTKSGMYSPHSSFYCFWEDRIGRVIESIEKANSCPVKIKSVSEILVKLCISFLFGDGSSMSYSPELDLVQTGLVMVSKVIDGWHARMTEPIVLTAGLNYLADQETPVLMDYFANQLFSPVGVPNLSRSERGHMMEYVIALRFIQGWWLQPELRKYLPRWAIDLNIKKPTGMVDCRTNKSNVNMFVQQLRRTNFPHIVFPPANAGPDLRYSVFQLQYQNDINAKLRFSNDMNLSMIVNFMYTY
ncbi:hypothetical protein BDEG_25082 [Batrachochytrium dendrobatidis JEL423]|uniref:Uncharacterized protein n=1 Tax=Batrachochytrium dendrobatidis (strain JEL423) TaxID=403673 RepID=A0A177WN05_BATDL|nr:hypothetical protein BDEG_25082 [Batrachochytrium dendrobatidis JEL423]